MLCIGLRLSSGLQGLQEAAPEPLGWNRQVTVPIEEEGEEGQCSGRRTAGGESEHEERRMSTRVV